MVSKTRYFELESSETGIVSRLKGTKKKFNPEDLKVLRSILTNEKGKIIYTIKNQKPHSIYKLAKILNRDLKSVREDLKILEKIGIIDYESTKQGKRVSHTPVLSTDRIEFILKI